MSRILDNVYAIRLSLLLYKPWTTWDAYKLGIIDKQGNIIKNPLTQRELDSMSYLHRLAANIKRIAEKVPGGKTLFAKAVAHYAIFNMGKIKSDKELSENTDEFWEMISNPENDVLIEGVTVVASGNHSSELNEIGSK